MFERRVCCESGLYNFCTTHSTHNIAIGSTVDFTRLTDETHVHSVGSPNNFAGS